MSREKFRNTQFKDETLARIAQLREIISEYGDQRLTARQVYYQFVSRGWLDNNERSYKMMTSLITDARYAGIVDWEAIEDRGREPINPPEYDSLTELVGAALNSYRLPRWKGQKAYVELWVEKQALAGVLAPIARRHHVTLMVNKGYCVDPSTRILTSDMRWVPASEIIPGQELVGADEDVPGPKKHRKLRLSEVEAITQFISPRMRVVTDRGSIVVSKNHPFLATRYANPANNGYYWVNAEQLKPGCRIAYLTKPWQEDRSWEAGWLAGMYDGEGCIPRTSRGLWMSVYQKQGPVEEQLRAAISARGWLDGERLDPKSGVVEFKTYSIDRVMSIVGSIRPTRMLNTLRDLIRLGRFPAKGKTPAIVLSIEPMLDGPVVGIQTSTGTLVTEGFVSHNSSASAMKEAADRFREAQGVNSQEFITWRDEFNEQGEDYETGSREHDLHIKSGTKWINENTRQAIVLYLGDHDPSGKDMVRDIYDRLTEFNVWRLEVITLGLTMEQIEQFNPPPNPAKITDSRAKAYIEKYGTSSWELDALPPRELNRIVDTALKQIINKKMMNAVIAQEDLDKERLRSAVAQITGTAS